MRIRKNRYVIFGFKDKATGTKLREFYKKHTGKDVVFNNIKHYNDGFKLLCFTLPLSSFREIGITEAIYRSSPEYIKFHDSIDKLIEWYENEYIKNASRAISWKEIKKVFNFPTKEPEA